MHTLTQDSMNSTITGPFGKDETLFKTRLNFMKYHHNPKIQQKLSEFPSIPAPVVCFEGENQKYVDILIDKMFRKKKEHEGLQIPGPAQSFPPRNEQEAKGNRNANRERNPEQPRWRKGGVDVLSGKPYRALHVLPAVWQECQDQVSHDHGCQQ